MTLMVALVGGQPLPNLLPARHYRPDSILMVYTQTTKKMYENLKAKLQQETAIYELETDAYDIVSIVEALNFKLEEPTFIGQSILFNLTGGTKAMALAAYQVAYKRGSPILYMESEGKRNRIYHYSWEEQQLKVVSKEWLPDLVQLSDLFDIHLGIGNWKEHGSPNNERGRFEDALAKVLHVHGYEVMTGIKTMKEQIDIDIAIRFRNQFGIIEAKSGEKGRTLEGIKQLSNTVRHIGTYTQTFYVITVPPTESHAAITDAAHIQVISLPEYVRSADRLSLNDEATFIASVDKAMKG